VFGRRAGSGSPAGGSPRPTGSPRPVRRTGGGALTEADLALYGGDSKEAITGFLAQINKDPEAVDAWTGLGLALGCDRMAPARAAAALLERPEVVLAVYREIRSNRSPVDLATWIGAQLDN